VESRDELRRLLDSCGRCRHAFEENVAILVADDNAALTDAQVVAVLDHLREQHEGAHSDVQ
jgi:hypothetical protein